MKYSMGALVHESPDGSSFKWLVLSGKSAWELLRSALWLSIPGRLQGGPLSKHGDSGNGRCMFSFSAVVYQLRLLYDRPHNTGPDINKVTLADSTDWLSWRRQKVSRPPLPTRKSLLHWSTAYCHTRKEANSTYVI